MKKTHFVTGATGFVGGALVLELLKKTGDDIYCLVRGGDSDACHKRLQETLQLSALAYGEDLRAEIGERCFAVPGDLDAVELPEAFRNGTVAIDHLWHSAASLKYAEKDRDFIQKVNVDGTVNLCALSNRLSAKNFHYISTAYVCGRIEGRIEEKLADPDTPTSNFYEKSKIMAENYLHRHCRAQLQILRPSIVIGHSKTYAPTSFSGMYGFMIDLNIFRRKVEKELGFLLYHRPLKLISVPDDPINLVPVDYVADSAVRIGLSGSDKKVFHLTNDTPGLMGDSLELIFEAMNFKVPKYVTDRYSFTEIDRKLDDSLEFYSSYLQGIKVFDRTNARAIPGVFANGFNLDKARLQPYIDWYMNYAESGGRKSRLEKDAFAASLSLQNT